MSVKTEHEVQISIARDDEGHIEVYAHVAAGCVGYLILAGNGVVMQLQVHRDFRRQGIATSLWRRAQAEHPGARHSILISEDGLSWAQSLGEEMVQAMPAAAGCS